MKKINLKKIFDVEKIKDLKDKKRVLVLAGGALVVVAALFIGITMALPKNNEKQLNNNMKELAKSFYEDFYWPGAKTATGGRDAFLGKFTETGIKIDLDNLSRYSGENVEKLVSEMKNSKTKKECDKNNTKAIIYPQEPFGQTDYKIEIVLDCGFGK